MPIFSDSYLNSLIAEAEEWISSEVKCIFSRFSLSVTAGTSTYTIPSDVIGIEQITWKGDKLDNSEIADFQYDSYLKPQNLGTQSKPKCYMRYASGIHKIMFYPIPNETLAADDTNIDNDTGIEALVILSTYRFATTSGTTQRLPDYLFRNLMKYYAMERAYAREGKGQNVIASGYFKKKFSTLFPMYKKIIETIPQAVQIQFGPAAAVSNKRPPRPVLPTSGKWSF